MSILYGHYYKLQKYFVKTIVFLRMDACATGDQISHVEWSHGRKHTYEEVEIFKCVIACGGKNKKINKREFTGV